MVNNHSLCLHLTTNSRKNPEEIGLLFCKIMNNSLMWDFQPQWISEHMNLSSTNEAKWRRSPIKQQWNYFCRELKMASSEPCLFERGKQLAGHWSIHRLHAWVAIVKHDWCGGAFTWYYYHSSFRVWDDPHPTPRGSIFFSFKREQMYFSHFIIEVSQHGLEYLIDYWVFFKVWEFPSFSEAWTLEFLSPKRLVE